MMPEKGARISVRPLCVAASARVASALASAAFESASSWAETTFLSARIFVLSYSILAFAASACACWTSAS